MSDTPQDAAALPADFTPQGIMDVVSNLRQLMELLKSAEVAELFREAKELLTEVREFVQALQEKDILKLFTEGPELLAALKELLAVLQPVLDLLKGATPQDVTAAGFNVGLLLKLLLKLAPLLSLLSVDETEA